MKKLLISLLSCLFIASAMAQTSSVAPTSEEIQKKNGSKIYKVIQDFFVYDYHPYIDKQFVKHAYRDLKIRIPLYLSTPRDVTIKYCWYSTKMAFGEEIRTSEEPGYIEEGTYVNGRLTMYKSQCWYYATLYYYDEFEKLASGLATIFYKFNWSADGEIISAHRYNDAGDEMVLKDSVSTTTWGQESSGVRRMPENWGSIELYGFDSDNKVRCEYIEY